MLSEGEFAQLYTLFPSVHRAEIAAVLAILPADKAVRLANGETHLLKRLVSEDVRVLTWRGTQLALPYRVYFNEPAGADAQHLTSQQRQLFHCLYLRHHNGFVRQRHLEQLLRQPADFTTPFTFSLLGEYVQEILEVLAASLTPELLRNYARLIEENPRYWQQTQGRVASYWDAYYRSRRQGVTHFRYYVGAKILRQLHQALRS